MYLPYLQNSVGSLTVVVRTDRDPRACRREFREAVRAADPELPVYSVRTLDSMVAAQAAPRRLAALLIGVFAGLALLLAAVGIYG